MEKDFYEIKEAEKKIGKSLPEVIVNYEDVHDKFEQAAKERGFDAKDPEQYETFREFMLSVENKLKRIKKQFIYNYARQEENDTYINILDKFLNSPAFKNAVARSIEGMPYFNEKEFNESDIIKDLKNTSLAIEEISKKHEYALTDTELIKVKELYRNGDNSLKNRVLDYLEDINYHSEAFDLETEDYTVEDILEELGIGNIFEYSVNGRTRVANRQKVREVIAINFEKMRQSLYRSHDAREELGKLLAMQDRNIDDSTVDKIVEEILDGQNSITYPNEYLKVDYYKDDIEKYVVEYYPRFVGNSDKRELFFSLAKDEFENKKSDAIFEIVNNFRVFVEKYQREIKQSGLQAAKDKGFDPENENDYGKLIEYTTLLGKEFAREVNEFFHACPEILVYYHNEDKILDDFLDSPQNQNVLDIVPMPKWNDSNGNLDFKEEFREVALDELEIWVDSTINDPSGDYLLALNLMQYKENNTLGRFAYGTIEALYSEYVEQALLEFVNIPDFLRRVGFHKLIAEQFSNVDSTDYWLSVFRDEAFQEHSLEECNDIIRRMNYLTLYDFAIYHLNGNGDAVIAELFGE